MGLQKEGALVEVGSMCEGEVVMHLQMLLVCPEMTAWRGWAFKQTYDGGCHVPVHLQLQQSMSTFISCPNHSQLLVLDPDMWRNSKDKVVPHWQW